MQNFSNSTLGTISKLTAGFASFEGIKKGLDTGFETGSEYQNLRLVLIIYMEILKRVRTNSQWQLILQVTQYGRKKTLLGHYQC